MRRILASCAATVVVWVGAAAQGQMEFEQAPIEYGQRATTDRVTRLATALEAGQVTLQYDSELGYLPAVLEALEISPDSQTLVFSKTSFQLHKINTFKPRAIYFNDDTYVGWVRGSDTLELAASDPEQGAIFFTLEGTQQPRVLRDQGQCLICHASVRTQSVPGLVVRSIISDSVGRPTTGTPTFVTSHSSPFEERWGGWYVTGQHGGMRHLGNVTCRDPQLEGWVDREAGANWSELPASIHPQKYLRQTSDIVALMVLEHQAQMHNLMTRAGFEARTAAYQDAGINAALGRPDDYQSESTGRRIASVSEKLVKYMLLAEEIALTDEVVGNSPFAKQFSERGPKDPAGRSLYQLDLKRYLFAYPCSYLIYSESFDALPETVKRQVGKRLEAVLVRSADDQGYERLTAADRQAVAEILQATKGEFWNRYVLAHSASSAAASEPELGAR
jgi:hypothetical protein